jgi:hypothetical protein
MNSTPRTEAQRFDPVHHFDQGGSSYGQMKRSPDGDYVPFELARELECENARMRETLAKIKTAVEPKKCFDDIAPSWGWIVEREIEWLCNSALSPAIPDLKP